MNIPVSRQDFELEYSLCAPNIHVEGSVSQNFDLGPSFYFMTITGSLLLFSFPTFLHFIK